MGTPPPTAGRSLPLIEAGIYTVPDAARLIGVTHAQMRGWIAGYSGSGSGAVLVREFPRMGWKVTLGFRNLIEALFIKSFADVGFSLHAIRAMAEAARELFSDPHPFARQLTFSHDNRAIFAELVNTTGEKDLYNLRRRNYAFEPIMRAFLRQPITFEAGGYAKEWYPRKDVAPNVVVTPRVAFGQPVMRRSRVPTRALFDALSAEHGSHRTVAKWYEVSEAEVREAEAFEQDLQAAA